KSSVTIRVDAHWTPLGPGILGSAGPADYKHDFEGAPKTKTWYPIALANRIAKKDLTPGGPHIEANFSSVFSNWYFGTDNSPPDDEYDLMSVILHELGHGLGFIGSMSVAANGMGSWGLGTPFPLIFDQFAQNTSKKRLLDTKLFPSPS